MLRYENTNEKIVDLNNCIQVLEVNNAVKRSVNGDPIVIGEDFKYRVLIHGLGTAPSIKMNEILLLECGERVYQNVSSNESNIKRTIVPGSLFLKTANGKIMPLKSANEMKNYDGLELSYRMLLRMIAVKLISKAKQMELTWELELREV